jgi:hypothetical protein
MEICTAMARSKGGSIVSRMASGSPPSDYLTSGEVVKWQGKPAAIIILGRGLLLLALSIVFLVGGLSYDGDHSKVLEVVIALFACVIMIVVERRLGLIGGLAGIAIVALETLDSGMIQWYVYLVPLIFGIVALLINYIYLSRVMFVITDRRIITRYGIFTLRYADIGVEKVQNVTVIQPWWERILGFGDIFFATAGEKGGIDYESPGIKLMSGGAVSWDDVSRPFEVVRLASEVVNPGPMPVTVVNQPVQAPPVNTVQTTQDRLKQLDELKRNGSITQQEYDEKRKQILEKL